MSTLTHASPAAASRVFEPGRLASSAPSATPSATRSAYGADPRRTAYGLAIPAEIEELVRWRTVESENLKRRPLLRTQSMTDTSIASPACAYSAQGAENVPRREVAITAAHTEAAKQWSGWGTALKPAWEPICVARKPLQGTVAANVLAHGTGALNIDG